MIIGEYPCCGASLMIELPDGELPKLAPDNCPECGEKVWHKFSRIDPKSWTDEDFLKEHVVDEVNSAQRKLCKTGWKDLYLICDGNEFFRVR